MPDFSGYIQNNERCAPISPSKNTQIYSFFHKLPSNRHNLPIRMHSTTIVALLCLFVKRFLKVFCSSNLVHCGDNMHLDFDSFHN